jgi:hypothetical protein
MFVVSAAVHAWHGPGHALSQQTPSTQNPLRQPLAAGQAVPVSSRQFPAPSQLELPVHVALVWPWGTKPQVPVPQVWQVPVHAALQQTPPAQKPLSQSPGAEHVCPFTDLQSPVPSQTFPAAMLQAMGG